MSKTKAVVTFFAWLDDTSQGKGSIGIPSKMTVLVSGGSIHMDANGRKYLEQPKQVQFLNGRLTTDDDEVIATIRKLAEHDRNISESEEVFRAHVGKPADRLKAKTAVVAGLRETNATLAKESAEKDREIERLKEKLARENEELQKMLDKGKSE